MKSLPILVLAASLALLEPSAAATGCVWGGFEADRLREASETLDGETHDDLRALITARSGSIGPLAGELTASYLAGIDVFYTSNIRTVDGGLSSSEQAALQAWVAGGGTLIVSAGWSNGYETFTGAYGVDGFIAWDGTPRSGSPTGSHGIIDGITAIRYAFSVAFRHGADMQLIGVDDDGLVFMAVGDPTTGFAHGGRLLVIGSPHVLDDWLIAEEDNAALAANVVAWACSSTTPSANVSWSELKSRFR